MENEELVIACLENTRILGELFAVHNGLHDRDEWRSLAYLELVMLAARWEQYPITWGSQVARFWSVARVHIKNRLIDRLRHQTSRGKVKVVATDVAEIEDRQEPAPFPFDAIGARMAIERAKPALTRKQREVVDADLAGVPLPRSYDAHRWGAIQRMREVLCG
jgi:hypothetical protein